MSVKLVWDTFTKSPWMMYLKLAIIGILVAASAYFAWDYRGALGERERTEAIADAVREINTELKLERQMRKHFEDLADLKYVELVNMLSNIKIVHTTTKTEITNEIAANPVFYSQPLPLTGYEKWKQARTQLLGPVPSPASSASSPSQPAATAR